MQSISIGAWVPQVLVPLLIMLAGFALVFQARRLAGTLFLMAIGAIMVPPLMQTLRPIAWQTVQQLPAIVSNEITRAVGGPEWVQNLAVVLAAIVIGYSLFVFIVLGVVRWLFGREVYVQLMGTLLVEPVRFLLAWPFLLIGWVFRRVFRRP